MNVEEWETIFAKEIAENRQPVASGSGLLVLEQIAPSTSTTQSMRSPLIGEPQVELSSFEGMAIASTPMSGPQVNPISIGGPQPGPTPFSGPQGSRRVLFGSIFDASSGQGGNNDNNGYSGNGDIVAPRTI